MLLSELLSKERTSALLNFKKLSLRNLNKIFSVPSGILKTQVSEIRRITVL